MPDALRDIRLVQSIKRCQNTLMRELTQVGTQLKSLEERLEKLFGQEGPASGNDQALKAWESP